MPGMPTAWIPRPSLTSNANDVVFSFLAPSIQCTKHSRVARFSTSPALWKRDNNKNRGLSILRHTGPRKRQTFSIKKYLKELPKPVEPKKPLEGGDADHGLWGFFHDKKLLREPIEESHHGRAWTVPDLRKRTWPDLHSLWWVCVKERNRLATEKIERARLKAAFGDKENSTRDMTVQDTMNAIMETLQERHRAWEEAHRLASQDPSIDLNKTDGPQLVMETYDASELFDSEDVAGGVAQGEGKEMPEKDFFNTPTNPPRLKDRVKAKVNKILWNK